MNKLRMWPHGALIIFAFVVVGAVGGLLWTKYERKAEASSLPNAARIERVEGQVGVNQSSDNSNSAQWITATPNMSVTVGDRIYTKQNSRTQVAFTGRNVATVDANTSLDVLDLSAQRTQVALRDGSALFDVGSLASGNLFEVATPCGAVDLKQPGLYQIAINDNGTAVATVFSGEAQVVGHGGSGQIQKGEYLTVPCGGNNDAAVISKVEPNQAGYVVDNYYRSRYPKNYDGRYRNYYTYLDDPDYYDPAHLYSSYNYVNDYIPGIDDLDEYGDWRYVSDYGYVWHPRVNSGWAPYESGYWTMDNPYGLTWVSNEPWGYAPYHYGRWANASNEWVWVPESVNTYPTYSPALVAFIPLGKSSTAWVALGPSDPYQVTYYDTSWQPVYTNPSNVAVDRLVNINVPGAVTVVPTYDFGRVIDPTVITRVDPQTITRVRPVLNPLAVDDLRAVAFQTRDARQRIDVPRQVIQRLDTPVVASTIVAPRFRPDLAKAMRVEPVNDRVRNQKLQVTDQRAAAPAQMAQPANIAAEQERERQIADLSKQAARGDKNARQQLQDLRKQQADQRAAGRSNVQAQGQVVGQPVRPQDQKQMERQQQQAQREAARQQMIQSQQQQRAATQQAQQQMQAQREQRRNQAQQERQTRNAQQQQMLKSQPPKRRPPEAAPPQAQPQPARVQSAPSAAPPAQSKAPAQPKPQAQPRSQPVRPPQAQPKAQPPGQSKPPGKKKPGGE
ncbi:MAG TPA: DUF6600 domain-containing protein [Pyrinomonadaceae bacterium]|nr:DUF6600 domain-containing protein [Pyrinomonadaceae bacterium]